MILDIGGIVEHPLATAMPNIDSEYNFIRNIRLHHDTSVVTDKDGTEHCLEQSLNSSRYTNFLQFYFIFFLNLFSNLVKYFKVFSIFS